MRALLCTEPGPLERLSVQSVPSPTAGPGQLLLRVKASALNFPDVLMAQGLYQKKPPLPFSPGTEVAGVVKEIGAGVQGFAIGDRVIAYPGLGGFAEECVAPAERTMALPEGMDFDVGAALILTYCTALHALGDCGRLQAGETLLVLGAAGGVGVAAIEVAKAMGAKVIAAASSDGKLALCTQAGTDATINYASEDVRRRALELTGGRGVDIVFDPVGGDYTEAALRSLRWRGRLLIIGFAAGTIPRIPLNLALFKERSLIGVYWGDAVKHDPQGHARNVRQLMDWFAAGRIRPRISERVSLAEAPAAMARMAQRQVTGKVVVLPEE